MMTDEDRELLQQAMTGVTPLPSHKKKKRPAPARKTEPASSLRWRQMRATHMPASTMEADLLATEHLEEVEPDAYVEHTSGQLTHQQMRKLRLGKLAVECTLDLHGCDFEEARALLKQFCRLLSRQGLHQCPGDTRQIAHDMGAQEEHEKPRHYLAQTDGQRQGICLLPAH